MKKNKGLEKIYKKLLFEDIKSLGFRFLRDTLPTKIHERLKKIPKSWKKIYFKTYPRLLQINFKRTIPRKNPLFSIITRRKSERGFNNANLQLKTINNILYFSSGIRNFNKIKNDFDKSLRMYPSAGARYPLEIYIAILRSKEISPGIYHYNIKRNSLELLLKGNFKKTFKKITNQSWIERSGIIVIIAAVFARTIIKYKERGWRYIFFEAGHLVQNIYLVSTVLKLKSCAIGGFFDNEIIKLLDLNPESELPLYMVAIGK